MLEAPNGGMIATSSKNQANAGCRVGQMLVGWDALAGMRDHAVEAVPEPEQTGHAPMRAAGWKRSLGRQSRRKLAKLLRERQR